MSKRKITILIIISIIIAALVFLYFHFYKGKLSPTNNNGDTNSYAGFGNGTSNNSGDNGTPADISGTGTNTGNNPEIDIKLKKVSSMPIAGFGIFSKERYKEAPIATTPENSDSTTENSTDNTTSNATAPKVTNITNPKNSSGTETVAAVRYAARATGNIYETFADKINEQKFSSTVIPMIYDAYFDSRAESVTMRYLKDDERTIETFAGTLPKETLGIEPDGNAELKGSFLPENIEDISLSSDLSKIFYLFNINDSITGVTASVAGTSKTEVFDSPFTEWLSTWPNANMITVTTKPASGLPGYMYAIDPAKKDLTKILGNINGLTTLTSPDAKKVLYSNNNLNLSIYNISTKNVTPLAIRTMPEKCVWSKTSDVIYCAVPKSINNGQYPDDWYQGTVSFSDQIWKINVADGSTSMIIDPISVVGGEEIDGIKLSLDKDQNYLFFINKKDSYLWELELN